MESSCFAVSFCIKIYASEVVIGYGFNPLCPCIWGFEFFSPGAPAVFLREEYAEYLPLAGLLLWCQLPVFSPQ
jgi:hypothetical protein